MSQSLPPEVPAAWQTVIEAAEAAVPAVRSIVAATMAAQEHTRPAYAAFVERAPGTVASQDAAGQVFLDRSGRDDAWVVVGELVDALLVPFDGDAPTLGPDHRWRLALASDK